MIKCIKKRLLNTEEKRRLSSNIISLGMLQGVNYILPLLTIPYLVRVLGPEYFGLLAFSTATIMYCSVVTEYGFNLSATRQVSINRSDADRVSEIFNAVMAIKLALMVLSLIFLSAIILAIDKFSMNWELYFLSFGLVVGQMLFPIWLFQGMERMEHITNLNIVAKFFFTACVFVFVKDGEDYLLVPLLTSLGSIFVGVWSLYLAKKEFHIKIKLPLLSSVRFQVIDGWHVFLSTVAISLYTISTTFILGLFTNNTTVGYFSAADKIIQAVKGLYQPISQAVYPLISKKVIENKTEALKFIDKMISMIGLLFLTVSTLLLVLAAPIVDTLLGAQYQESIVLLQIMAFLPLVIPLGNLFGIQAMLNFGYKREFSVIVLIAAFVGIILAFILVPLYEAIGMSIAMVIVECIITTALAIFFYSKIKRGVE